MQINKKMITGALALSLCFSSVAFAADYVKRGPLADGELFTSQPVAKDGRVLYSDSVYKQWAWHGKDGYPVGMVFAAFVNGKDLPETAKPAKSIGGVPKKEEMVAAARQRYAIQSYEDKLVIYATTGPSAAKTEIGIAKVELYGRLLNVTVALQDALPGDKMTMNLVYPETVCTIGRGRLPKKGVLRVRYADVQGHALQVEDVLLGL